jgi:hypothetical protein
VLHGQCRTDPLQICSWPCRRTLAVASATRAARLLCRPVQQENVWLCPHCSAVRRVRRVRRCQGTAARMPDYDALRTDASNTERYRPSARNSVEINRNLSDLKVLTWNDGPCLATCTSQPFDLRNTSPMTVSNESHARHHARCLQQFGGDGWHHRVDLSLSSTLFCNCARSPECGVCHLSFQSHASSPLLPKWSQSVLAANQRWFFQGCRMALCSRPNRSKPQAIVDAGRYRSLQNSGCPLNLEVRLSDSK